MWRLLLGLGVFVPPSSGNSHVSVVLIKILSDRAERAQKPIHFDAGISIIEFFKSTQPMERTYRLAVSVRPLTFIKALFKKL
jgi:hypothetical protein